MDQETIETRMSATIEDILDKNLRSRTSQLSSSIDAWESNILSDGNLLNIGLRNEVISKEFYDERAKQLDKELSILREVRHHFQKIYFP